MKKRSHSLSNVLKFTVLVLVASSVSLVAHSHDFWFAPEQFNVEKGLKFRIKMLFGGKKTPEGVKPLHADVTRKLEMHTYGKAPVNLLTSSTAVRKGNYTEITVEKPGSYWIMTERAPTYIELDAKKFESYLLEENLHDAIKKRRENKKTNSPGREVYSRSIKTYISVGDHTDSQTWKMRLPQRIEINPKVDPRSVYKGQKTAFEILFDGKPLKDISVNAMHSLSHDKRKILTSKTNNKGVVTFKLNKEGAWLIRLTYMRECKGCEKADWESFWGALALGVRPR